MEILISILSLITIAISFYIMAKVIDDYFIESLNNISNWLKLTPSVAGATIMAMGTSAPELSTALIALFLPNTNPATGIGTIVGSAIFQILVVIGFAAVVKTSYLDWKPIIRDGIFYAISVALLILFINDGVFTPKEAIIMTSFYLIYLFVLFLWLKLIKEDKFEVDNKIINEIENQKKYKKIFVILKKLTKPIDYLISFIPSPKKNHKYTIPVFVLSLLIIAVLSYLLVLSAESFATIIGVPSAIIALTILAGGTSIPELIGSAIVSKQGRGDMAISNALGSNIFDILLSLGLPLLIYTNIKGPLYDVGGSNINSSILLLFATLIAVLLLLISQKFKAGKKFGIILLTTYVIYVIAAYSGII